MSHTRVHLLMRYQPWWDLCRLELYEETERMFTFSWMPSGFSTCDYQSHFTGVYRLREEEREGEGSKFIE